MFCRNCGAQTDDAGQFCIKCGATLKEPAEMGSQPEPPSTLPPMTPPPGATAAPPPPGATPAGQWGPPPPPSPNAPWPPAAGAAKSKVAAGILGIVLGAFGVHRFYLGYNTIAIIQLVLGVAGILTCGLTTLASAIWGIIDGVMILTGSIATDANGVPLRD